MPTDSKSKQSVKVPSKKSPSSQEQELDRDVSSAREGNVDNDGMSNDRQGVSAPRSGKNLGNQGEAASKPVSSPNVDEDLDEEQDDDEVALGDEDIEGSVTGRHPSQREEDVK